MFPKNGRQKSNQQLSYAQNVTGKADNIT